MRPIYDEIAKVTEHYGYRKECNVFAIYNISTKKERHISAFEKESRARQECRYLENLNYGRKEDE